jgi:hypothetical protein
VGVVAYNPEHYKANKEKYSAKSKAWREANPEKAQVNRKRHYEENKERSLEYSRWYSLKKKFGLSKEQYEALLEGQNHVCAICGKGCTKALAVDHCHTTGKVRGLLCNNCNRGVGHLKDSVENMTNAITYLNRFKSV